MGGEECTDRYSHAKLGEGRVLHSGEGTLWTDLKSPTLTIPAK